MCARYGWTCCLDPLLHRPPQPWFLAQHAPENRSLENRTFVLKPLSFLVKSTSTLFCTIVLHFWRERSFVKPTSDNVCHLWPRHGWMYHDYSTWNAVFVLRLLFWWNRISIIELECSHSSFLHECGFLKNGFMLLSSLDYFSPRASFHLTLTCMPMTYSFKGSCKEFKSENRPGELLCGGFLGNKTGADGVRGYPGDFFLRCSQF